MILRPVEVRRLGQPGSAMRRRWKAMTMSVVHGHELLEADDGLAAGVGDDGGGMPDAVTQLLRFGDGELAVEAQLLGPGVKVLGDQHQLQPGFVADEVLAGQVAQPGVLGGADAVLDVSAVTVAQLERGDVVVGLVGDEHLMPEPFGGVEQRQLGAGVRAFATGDDPHPVTPVVVDEVGQLDQPGAVTTAPSVSIAGIQSSSCTSMKASRTAASIGRPTKNPTSRSMQPSMKSWVAPAVSVRTTMSVSAGDTGSWASAASNTAR